MNPLKYDDELRASFDADGFVVLRGFLSSQPLAELQANLRYYIERIVPLLPREEVFYENLEDRASLKQLQRLGDHDEWFHQFHRRSPFRRLAEFLLGRRVVPKNLQWFNKPAALGQPTPAHQDGYYFMIEPCEALTFWLALDKVDQSNGCVRYVRGSHRNGLRPHRGTDVLGFSQGITDFGGEEDLRDEVAVEAEPGDLLVHDALTIHRADGNTSPDCGRQALGWICYSDRACVSDSHAEYQAQLMDNWKRAERI